MSGVRSLTPLVARLALASALLAGLPAGMEAGEGAAATGQALAGQPPAAELTADLIRAGPNGSGRSRRRRCGSICCR